MGVERTTIPDPPKSSAKRANGPGSVHHFNGKQYDSDALAELLDELIAAHDFGKVCEAADVFALASIPDYVRAESQLQDAYGRKFKARQFAAAVKLAKREHVDAAKAGRRRIAIADVADNDPRPRVCLNSREPVSLAREIVAHLTASQDAALFWRDAALVRVRSTANGRKKIEIVTEDMLAGIIKETAVCYRVHSIEGEASAVPESPPRDAVRYILSLRDWPFPALDAIARGPVVRPDGTIATHTGYDATTRTWIAPDPGLNLPAIPEHPTQEDARQAAAYFRHVLSNMHYADVSGFANVLATALTIPLRPLIGSASTPICGIDATRAGSGKTGNMKVAVVAGTGLDPADVAAPITWTDNAEEMRKRIETALLDGATLIMVDNVRGTINLAALEAMLTSPAVQVRRLGVSEQPLAPVRATWIFTGNGMRVAGDSYRRFYFVHLDTKSSRPEAADPSFAVGDLDLYLPKHRGKLLAAVLTMIRAWYEAGCPAGTHRPIMGNYQAWADMMAGILDYAGVPGFLGTLDRDRQDADEDTEQWTPFLLTWRRMLNTHPVTARQIAKMCQDEPEGELALSLPDYIYRDLGRADRSLAVSLGHALRNRRGRRYGASAIRAEQCGEEAHEKVKQWHVLLPADDAPDADPDPPASAPTDADTHTDDAAGALASSCQDAADTAETVSSASPAPSSPKSSPDTTSANLDPWYVGERWYTPSRPDGALSQALQWACCGNVAAAHAWMRSAKLRQRWEEGSTIIAGATGTPGTSPAAFVSMLRRYYEHANSAMITHTAAYLGADPRGVLTPSAASSPATPATVSSSAHSPKSTAKEMPV